MKPSVRTGSPLSRHTLRAWRWRLAVAAVGASVATGAPADSAIAELRLEVASAPAVIRSGAQGQVLVFDVRVSAVERDERFALATKLPLYESQRRLPRVSEGSPLLAVGPPTVVDGPATFTGPVGGMQGRPGCSPSWPSGYHGWEVAEEQRELLAPAGTTSLVQYVYSVTDRPLWPGMDLRVRFVAKTSLGAPLSPPITPSEAVSPPITVTGRLGAQLGLRFSPIPPNPRNLKVVEVQRGRPLTVVGAIDPPLARQPIRLYRVPPNRPSARVWKTVKTDHRGRFRFEVARSKLGFAEIWPLYRGGRGRVLADHGCPLMYRVVKPPSSRHMLP